MISETVLVTADGAVVRGELDVPSGARAVVLFASGGDSSRHSPHDRAVAARLRSGGLATLLTDPLTEDEGPPGSLTDSLTEDQDPPDPPTTGPVALLGDRLVAAIDLLGEHPATEDLPVVLFGASTGAAAALVAAARRPGRVLTVVSRGGRPDLAGDALETVHAPVLLLVGGRDVQDLRLNQEAVRRMSAPHALRVVPGASRHFEEPGALERVADTVLQWCRERLRAARQGRRRQPGGAHAVP